MLTPGAHGHVKAGRLTGHRQAWPLHDRARRQTARVRADERLHRFGLCRQSRGSLPGKRRVGHGPRVRLAACRTVLQLCLCLRHAIKTGKFNHHSRRDFVATDRARNNDEHVHGDPHTASHTYTGRMPAVMHENKSIPTARYDLSVPRTGDRRRRLARHCRIAPGNMCASGGALGVAILTPGRSGGFACASLPQSGDMAIDRFDVSVASTFGGEVNERNETRNSHLSRVRSHCGNTARTLGKHADL
jgi:hypothetical protein